VSSPGQSHIHSLSIAREVVRRDRNEWTCSAGCHSADNATKLATRQKEICGYGGAMYNK
jgi:hypothetical protein